MSPSEKVGPNVVFRGMSGGAEVESGLGETIRARDGRVPWLAWHLERLRNAIRSLGLAEPAADLSELVRIAAGAGGRVVPLGVPGGRGRPSRPTGAARGTRRDLDPRRRSDGPHRHLRVSGSSSTLSAQDDAA